MYGCNSLAIHLQLLRLGRAVWLSCRGHFSRRVRHGCICRKLGFQPSLKLSFELLTVAQNDRGYWFILKETKSEPLYITWRESTHSVELVADRRQSIRIRVKPHVKHGVGLAKFGV